MKELLAKSYGYIYQPTNFILFILISFLVIIFAVMVSIFFHELGHVLGGLISRYRLLFIRIGTIFIGKKEGKFRVERVNGKMSSGQCVLLPTEKTKSTTIMFASGPCMNIFLFGLSLYLAYNSTYIISLVNLTLIGFINLALALINLLPNTQGELESDGLCIKQIRNDNSAIQCHLNQLNIGKELYDGNSFADVRQQFFSIPTGAVKSKNVVGYSLLYQYYRVMEEGKLGKGTILINELGMYKTNFVKGLIREIEIEELFLRLMRMKCMKIDMQREIDTLNKMENTPYVLRIRAAVAYIEHDYESYQRLLMQLEEDKNSTPYKGEIKANITILKKFIDNLEVA